MESTSDLGNSIALTDAIGWSISGIGWTAAYFLFMRSTKTHGAPCLPPLAYALNFAWEINLGLFTPPSRITQIIYTQWAVIDVALLWNQVKYGGMEAWEFLWMLILATGWEAACVKTAVSVAGAIGMAGGVGVGGLEEEVVGGAEGQARMLITFWLGYVCQTVISFWSLREVVRGRGKHLTYGMWAGRAIGSYAAGLLIIRRALVMPEEHWYVLGPIGLWFLGSTMLADAVWPIARYMVEQKTAGEVKEMKVAKKKL